jgi:hypothetical protein
MKVHKFRIDGRTFDAVMSMKVVRQMAALAGDDENGAPLDINEIMRRAGQSASVGQTLVLMIREGERLAGRECEIDEAWIEERTTPGEAAAMQRRVLAIMVEAMKMETMDGEDVEVDEVLEDIQKK